MQVNIKQNSLLRRNGLIREGLREVLTRMSIHRTKPGEKDIILLSSGRSGSTLLMESLSAEPGLRFVNEPFSRKHLAQTSLAQHEKFGEVLFDKKFLSLTEEERDGIDKYMADYSQIRRAGPYNPFKSSFHIKSDRLLFKVLKMNMVLDYFLDKAEQYEFLWLVRHPGPTILSSLPMRVRYNAIDLEKYYQEDSFREHYLTEEQVSLMKKIHTSGTEQQVWAAEWAIDHLVSFLHFKESNAANLFLVSYEQLVVNPELVTRKLADRFGLRRTDLVLKELKIPSASTRTEVVKEYVDFNANKKIEAWRKKSAPGYEAVIFDVIESFGIDLYSRGRDILNEEYLIQ